MTLDYEGFIKSYDLLYTFIIMIYCLFGTQLAKYVCSTNRKMFLCNLVIFAKTPQPFSVNTEKLEYTFELTHIFFFVFVYS